MTWTAIIGGEPIATVMSWTPNTVTVSQMPITVATTVTLTNQMMSWPRITVVLTISRTMSWSATIAAPAVPFTMFWSRTACVPTRVMVTCGTDTFKEVFTPPRGGVAL
jgi:hypothetical protein